MQGLLRVLLVFLWMPLGAVAATIAYEPFDYPAGPVAGGKNGGTGWAGAWSGTTLGSAAGLAYPSLVTSGYRATLTGSDKRASRAIATNGLEALLTPAGKFGKTGTEIWLSYCFAVQRTAVGLAAGTPVLQLMNGATPKFPLGLLNWLRDRNPGQLWPTFAVIRLRFVTDGMGVELYANPVPGSAPPPVADSSFITGVIEFDRLGLYSNDEGAVFSFDELRVGETYADVAPSNGRLEMMILRGVATGGFTATTEGRFSLPVLLAGPGLDSASPQVSLTTDNAAVAGPGNLRWFPTTNRAGGRIEVEPVQAGACTLTAEARLEGFEAISTNLALQIVEGSPAGLLAYDGFDYEKSTAGLNGQKGGVGFKSTWVSARQTTLTDDSLPLPGLLVAGRHLESTALAAGALVSSRALAAPMGQNGTVRYLSFTVRAQGQLHVGEYGGYFGVEIPGTVGSKIFIGKPGNGARNYWGMESSGGALQASSLVPVVTNETALLVVKMEFFEGPDRISLFVNPTPGAPEPDTARASLFAFDLGKPSTLTFASSGAWAADELRLGATWRSVTPNPSVQVPLKLAAPSHVYAAEDREVVIRTGLTEDIAPLAAQFTLQSPPDGMTIDPQSGLIRFTPGETNGPATIPVRVRVVDNISPQRSDEISFELQVSEVNHPARLAPIVQPVVVQAGSQFQMQLSAVDPDVPVSETSFRLFSGLEGATLSKEGLLDWSIPVNFPSGPTNLFILIEDHNSLDPANPMLLVPQALDFKVLPATPDPTPFSITDSKLEAGGFSVSVIAPQFPTLVLEKSPGVSGPWAAVVNATSEPGDVVTRLIDPTPAEGYWFYRVRAQ